jgi:hypothetical protein
MLGVSRRYNPRPTARDVLLTWARASSYEDRVAEYLKLAHLAPDRDGRNRFLELARHCCTLAEIERCVPIRQRSTVINRKTRLIGVALDLLPLSHLSS